MMLTRWRLRLTAESADFPVQVERLEGDLEFTESAILRLKKEIKNSKEAPILHRRYPELAQHEREKKRICDKLHKWKSAGGLDEIRRGLQHIQEQRDSIENKRWEPSTNSDSVTDIPSEISASSDSFASVDGSDTWLGLTDQWHGDKCFKPPMSPKSKLFEIYQNDNSDPSYVAWDFCIGDVVMDNELPRKGSGLFQDPLAPENCRMS